MIDVVSEASLISRGDPTPTPPTLYHPPPQHPSLKRMRIGPNGVKTTRAALEIWEEGGEEEDQDGGSKEMDRRNLLLLLF